MGTKPTILDDLGASAHLRLAGIVGGSASTFTDADIRDAPNDGRATLERLRRDRFVQVTEFRVGQRDTTYTVSYEVPSVTHVHAQPTKKPAVPPSARRGAKRR